MAWNSEKICAYTQNALDSLEDTKEKIEQLETSLREKKSYNQKLEEQDDFICNLNSEKLVFLDDKENIPELSGKNIVDLRETAQKVYNFCLENLTKSNEIDNSLPSLKQNLEIKMKSLQSENDACKQKIDGLTSLLERLNSEQEKKQNTDELRKSLVEEENEKLSKEIEAIEELEKMYTVDEVGQNLIEENIDEMNIQLKILTENREELKQNVSLLDEDDVLLKKIHEEKMEILKKRSTESAEEILDLEKKYNKILNQELEYSETVRSLEEYDAKIKNDIEKTSKFWEDLLTNSDSAFKKIEAEFNKIRHDIEERNDKYSVMEEQKQITIQEMEKIEGFLLENSLDNLKSNLHEAETELEKLATSLEQSVSNYDSLVAENKNLVDVRVNVEKILEEKKLEHIDLRKELDKVTSRENEELTELKNKIVIEEKCLEKDNTALENTKLKIEKQVQEMAEKINQLKEKINNLTAEKENKAAETTEVRTKEENLRKEVKKLQLQNIETNKKIYELTAKKKWPQKKSALPTIEEVEQPVKKTDLAPGIPKKSEKNLSDKFTRPKTPEPRKQKALKKTAEKRIAHWNSDSSQEDEIIPFAELLKNKNKKKFF